MLKNLHVITGIIFALTIFCLLQVVTGGLFYSAVSNDRHNFQNSGVLNAQQESLSDSVNTLVKTRVTVTRVAIRYLKNQRDPASLAAINKLLGTAGDSLAKAEAYNKEWQKLPQVKGQEAALTDEMQKSWNQMHEVMRLSIEYLRADNYQAYGDLDAQQAQDDMEAVYNRWRAENNTLAEGRNRRESEQLHADAVDAGGNSAGRYRGSGGHLAGFTAPAVKTTPLHYGPYSRHCRGRPDAGDRYLGPQ